MSKKLKTSYSSTDPEIVDLGWELKRIGETHSLRQQALMDEYKAKSEALTETSQADQLKVFRTLADKIGLGAENYGDGDDWVLDIARIALGEVTLAQRIHVDDLAEAHADDDSCQCVICKLRRALTSSSSSSAPSRLH